MDNWGSFVDTRRVDARQPGLAVQYVRLVADVLAAQGVDVDRLLRRHGMTAAELAGADATISFATFQALARDAVEVSGEPALGIVVGDRLATANHGALGLAAVSSATIRELLDVLARFLSSRIAVLALSTHVDGDAVHIELQELVDLGFVRQMVLEAVLLSVKNTLRDASMGRCPITRARLPFARPSYGAQAEATFGCEIIYGAGQAGVEIPSAVLDEPLRMADRRAVELAASLCERELHKLGRGRSFEIRTRRLMLEPRHGFPSLPQVARRLHLTPRTLARKLAAEGTSYREILEDLRYRMARDLIKSGSGMDEVAYLLGYTDTANFRRAFRRWTGGDPPSTMRGS